MIQQMYSSNFQVILKFIGFIFPLCMNNQAATYGHILTVCKITSTAYKDVEEQQESSALQTLTQVSL